MLNYELRQDEGILVLHPEGPLEATDFNLITSRVDAYLAEHGKLHGLLIQAKSFPGWKGFAAMLAHLKFIEAHIQRIEKVAVVADGVLANIMPDIAKHFVHAEIKHFDFVSEDAAWLWLNIYKVPVNPGASTDNQRP
jgi:hypothetical protein